MANSDEPRGRGVPAIWEDDDTATTPVVPPKGNGGDGKKPELPKFSGWDFVILAAMIVLVPLIAAWGWKVLAVVVVPFFFLVVIAIAGVVVAMVAVPKETDGELVKKLGLKLHEGLFVRAADFTWVKLLQADEAVVWINRLKARKGSNDGWYTGGNWQWGRVAFGCPYLHEPVAIIDLSDEEIIMPVSLNAGNEGFIANLRVVVQVIQGDLKDQEAAAAATSSSVDPSDERSVALSPATARLLLTELDKEAVDAIQERVQTVAQQVCDKMDPKIEGSIDLKPPRYPEFNRLMSNGTTGLLDEQIKGIGFLATAVQIQNIISAVAEEQKEIKVLVDEAGVNPQLAYAGVTLKEIISVFAGIFKKGKSSQGGKTAQGGKGRKPKLSDDDDEYRD